MKYYITLVVIAMSMHSCNTPTKYDLAITHVKLFDSTTKKVSLNRTILINADTIASIINANTTFRAKK